MITIDLKGRKLIVSAVFVTESELCQIRMPANPQGIRYVRFWSNHMWDLVTYYVVLRTNSSDLLNDVVHPYCK